MNKQEFEKAIDELDIQTKATSCTVSIKSCQLAISTLEKQMPKKIDRVGNKCPVCKCYLASKPIGDNYCFNCGQAIDWGNEDE